MATGGKTKIRLLLDLFWSFLKISPVTFGGGYAMIPLIEREIVVKRKWLKAKEMPDMLALAGTAPGAIGVNTAILIGYRIAGIRGAMSAAIGMVMPTFAIIVTATALLMQVADHPWAKAAFQGIAPAIVAIILYAGYRIGRSSIHDWLTFAIACAALLVLIFVPIHPIWLILAGGVLSYAGSGLYSRVRKPEATVSRSDSATSSEEGEEAMGDQQAETDTQGREQAVSLESSRHVSAP